MMATESVLTPRRVYDGQNVCLLCAFSFVHTEISSTGEKHEVKLFKHKLRLTDVRVNNVKKIIPSFDVTDEDKNNGFCTKCYKIVEKIFRQEEEVEKIKSSLIRTHQTCPKRLKTVEKRLLRSPFSSVKQKQQKQFPSQVIVKHAVKLPSFSAMCTMPLMGAGLGVTQPHVPLSTCNEPATCTIVKQFVDIAPRPTEYDTSLSSVIGEHTHVKIPTVSYGAEKTARRSLGFSGKENEQNLPYEGEVKLTVHYPSGTKNTYVYQEIHKKICKTILQGVNVEKGVLNIIAESNPMMVMNAAGKIVKEESSKLCKRGSGTILQKKEYSDIFSFNWKNLYDELSKLCPGLLTIISSVVADSPPPTGSKAFHHILLSAAIGLHGRSQEMSLVQYMMGFILTHGGCTLRDIERLASIGLSVHPKTIHNRLQSWQGNLDTEIISLRNAWSEGGLKKYQLIGDNWDKNILPSFRTSLQKTLSLHLFNLIAVVDRITPNPAQNITVLDISEIDISTYLPSISEQEQLMTELTFIFATSVISNVPQLEQSLKSIYPKHLEHKYSIFSGIKTVQYPLGLFKCNENKTQELIRLLKQLTEKYVPLRNGEIFEPVFLGGDRLTDERAQSAQTAMSNADSPKEKLEGFISKIEDFHRLMNFLEAIYKLTYNTESASDKGTMHYYRNLLNMRNVKGKVKNAYRPFKLLYYTILDAICLLLFLDHLKMTEMEKVLPENFQHKTKEEKIAWINDICRLLIQQWFFEDTTDICQNLREVVFDRDHPVNYWLANLENGRIKCHFCPKSYAYIGSLKSHESKVHNLPAERKRKTVKPKDNDRVQDYIASLFKLVLLHKNLDTAVDMGDGGRSVRSAKYELPVYNKTNKTKYAIGSIHLTALTSGLLPSDQEESLINNRFINLQGGKNNNIALDEFVEMLNRDSKVACSGHQTVESIIAHSKEYPIIINITKHFDAITEIHQRKGFHHLPSYKADVLKVMKDLQELNVLENIPGRTFKCKALVVDRNPYDNCFEGLPSMIYRHRPHVPFRRLRDPHL